jgi:ankyrin repeat protein
VLSSIIVHNLRREFLNLGIPVLCIFLETKTQTEAQTVALVRGGLLNQLVQFRNEDVSESIIEAYKRACGVGYAPGDDDITDLLKDEIALYQRVLVVADGLDEASNEARVFVEQNLQQLSPEKVYLLTMGRPDTSKDMTNISCDICGRQCVNYHRCQESLEPSSDHEYSYDICPDCVVEQPTCLKNPAHRLKKEIPDEYQEEIITPGDEIKEILKEMIQEQMPRKTDRGSSVLGRACSAHPDLFKDIIDLVTISSGGRLRLAMLHIRSLELKQDLRSIKESLDHLRAQDNVKTEEDSSKAMNLLYSGEMMQRIKAQNGHEARLAFRIFSIIYHARALLTLTQLKQAVAVRVGDSKYDPDGENDRQSILSVTKGLVTIERNNVNEIVRLDHHTLTEYFDETADQWFPTGNEDMALTCLTFLSFSTFSAPHKTEGDFNKVEESLPFISYAVQYWGDHVFEAGPEATSVISMATAFLKNESRVKAFSQMAWLANTPDHDKWDVRGNVNALHICAWYDLHYLIAELGEPLDVDVQESTYKQTPLMYACKRGNYKVARKLLELGASANMLSDKGRTALFEVILRPGENSEASLKIVQLLSNPEFGGLQLNVNQRNPKLYDRTALQVSIDREQTEIALKLLQHPLVDVNMRDRGNQTALTLGAYKGMSSVVKALLKFDNIDIDAKETSGGRTALILAVMSNHSQVVRELLIKGANADVKDMKGYNALLWAVNDGNATILEIIVHLRPGLSCRDEYGRGLLHLAAVKGHDHLFHTHMLSDNSLELNAVDDLGMTPLHLACQAGSLETVRTLLDRGADISAKDKFGRAPVDVAYQYGNSRLIDKVGPNYQLVIGSYIPRDEDVTLWSLATRRLIDPIRAAINTGKADLNLHEPGTENTALHCALITRPEDTTSPGIQIEIIKELLKAETLSADWLNKQKRSPLHVAAWYGNLAATKLLISHNVKLDQIDRYGLTALQIAIQRRYFAVAVALLSAEAHIEKAKVNMEELLFAAIELENPKAVGLLLEAGAYRLAVDQKGNTVDQLVSKKNNAELMAILYRTKSVMFKEDSRTEVRAGTETMLFGGVPASEIPIRPFRSRQVMLEG